MYYIVVYVDCIEVIHKTDPEQDTGIIIGNVPISMKLDKDQSQTKVE